MDVFFLTSRRVGGAAEGSAGHSPDHPTSGNNVGYTSGPLSAFNTKVIIVTACLLAVLILALLVNILSRWFLRRLLLSGSAAGAGHGAHPPTCKVLQAGLRKDSLQSLPTTIYTCCSSKSSLHQVLPPDASLHLQHAEVKEEEEDDASLTQCPICLVDFRDGERIRVLPKCEHGFHVPCIDTWLAKSSSCPTCRGDLMDSLPS